MPTNKVNHKSTFSESFCRKKKTFIKPQSVKDSSEVSYPLRWSPAAGILIHSHSNIHGKKMIFCRPQTSPWSNSVLVGAHGNWRDEKTKLFLWGEALGVLTLPLILIPCSPLFNSPHQHGLIVIKKEPRGFECSFFILSIMCVCVWNHPTHWKPKCLNMYAHVCYGPTSLKCLHH